MNWAVIFKDKKYFDLVVKAEGGSQKFKDRILRELDKSDPNCLYIFAWRLTHQKAEFWTDPKMSEKKRELLNFLISETVKEEELWV